MRPPLSWITRALSALVLLVPALGTLAAPAAAGPASWLGPGQALGAGQSLASPNGAHRLVVQGDGNVVLYGPAGATWATGTRGLPHPRLVMQPDGNLVLYGGAGPAWFTGTIGYAGSPLAVQDDGNLVQYAGPAPLWASSWHVVRGLGRSTNFGSYGYCTWYATERFREFSAIYPAASGNALYFDDSLGSRGWRVQPNPTTQAVVVFEPGVQGASPIGHLGWVDFMSPRADGTYLHIWEMNARGFGVVSDRWVKHVPGMSYVTAPWK